MSGNNKYLHLIRQDCPLPSGTLVDVYCRDSGGETQERSIGQQREMALEYIDAHHLVLNEIYTDEAATGSNTDNRTGLNKMLSDIAAQHARIGDIHKRERHMAKNPRGVIVFKSNRLGRDSIETSLTKSDLRVRGVTIIELMPTIITGDATVDAILEAVQLAQDEKLLRQISTDSKRGLAELVGIRDTDAEFRRHNPDWPTSDGRYIGIMPGPPHGFAKQPVTVGQNNRKRGGEKRVAQRLIPHPDEWTRAQGVGNEIVWRIVS